MSLSPERAPSDSHAHSEGSLPTERPRGPPAMREGIGMFAVILLSYCKIHPFPLLMHHLMSCLPWNITLAGKTQGNLPSLLLQPKYVIWRSGATVLTTSDYDFRGSPPPPRISFRDFFYESHPTIWMDSGKRFLVPLPKQKASVSVLFYNKASVSGCRERPLLLLFRCLTACHFPVFSSGKDPILILFSYCVSLLPNLYFLHWPWRLHSYRIHDPGLCVPDTTCKPPGRRPQSPRESCFPPHQVTAAVPLPWPAVYIPTSRCMRLRCSSDTQAAQLLLR